MRYIARQNQFEEYHTVIRHEEYWVEATITSHVGKQKRVQQDCFGIRYTNKPRFVVADGLSNPALGEIASKIAAEMFTQTNDETLWESGLHTNTAILERYSIPQFQVPGTTVVALELDKQQAKFYHIGDSRGYRYHNGQLEQVTIDHSVGALDDCRNEHTPKESYSRRFKSLELSLGVRNLENRILNVAIDAGIPIDHAFPLVHGDSYLLCTDGVTDYITRDGIERFMKNEDLDIVDALVFNAIAFGGKDNITACVVNVYDPKKLPFKKKLTLGFSLLYHEQGFARKIEALREFFDNLH